MELRTYRTDTGRAPFEDWFADLDKVAAARVSQALRHMRQGQFGNTKPVGGGVSEFRIDFGPGYRVYFGRDGQEIILLLTGGDKRRQQRDIDAAITFWQDYRREKRGA
jgi:putative addiction module killer protein